MDIKKGEGVLDLACGQGFFAREFAGLSDRVVGVDVSPALIALARRNMPKNIDFRVASADSLPFLKDRSVDKIAIVLALQNIRDVAGVFRECTRVLKPGGMLFAVITHPAFRVPRASSWEWDEKEKTQYRRIDRYLSEAKVKIQMHPGDQPDQYTLTFHRPLQFYFKALNKAGLSVSALEEWNSNRKSDPGPRANAENEARKEIPLFLCLIAKNLQTGPRKSA